MEEKRLEEQRIQVLINEEKARLLAEHEAILRLHYSKAVRQYNNWSLN
jgi:hypothetical protein